MSAAFEKNEGPSCSKQMEVNEPEDSATLSKWDYLPAVPLRMIYSLVPRTEQKHMSSVNKKWLDEYESPNNWSTLRFTFPTKTFTIPFLPSVKFALRYGRLVKHLEISCRHKCRLSFLKVLKQYEAFVKAIRERSHLQSITVFNLKQIFSHIGVKYRSRVVKGICKIFKTEKTIQSASFSLCSFNRKEMEMIFTNMFVKSSSPITKLRTMRMQRRLKLKFRFRWQHGEQYTRRNYLWIINMLQRLEEWETDYRKIVERVITGFSEITREELAMSGRGISGTLKLFTIRYEEWSLRGVNQISSRSWKALHTFCPDLKVDFTIGPTANPRKSLKMLLPSGVPLHAFTFHTSWRKHSCANFQIKEVFSYLKRKQLIENLEYFTIVWAKDSSPTDIKDLDRFIRICPMLKSVEVQIAHPQPLQDLFVSWIDSRPAFLEEVLFTLNKIPSEEEYNQLNSMAQRFIPSLKQAGLDFTLNLALSRN